MSTTSNNNNNDSDNKQNVLQCITLYVYLIIGQTRNPEIYLARKVRDGDRKSIEMIKATFQNRLTVNIFYDIYSLLIYFEIIKDGDSLTKERERERKERRIYPFFLRIGLVNFPNISHVSFE